ncbi:MAG: hypothetical protein E7310_03640 [Clostridiales bacterium]|nr:hypothetical protein [Clostridiales bacterium]
MHIILIICFIIFFLLLVIFFSTLKIKIKEVKIDTDKNLKIYDIDFCFYFFKIMYFKVNVNNKKIKKNKFKSKILEKILNVEEGFDKWRIKKIIGIINSIKIETIHLNIDFGLDDVIATSFATAVISSILGILLANKIQEYKKDNVKYKVVPFYINRNFLNLELNCIIFTKVVHIIHMIIKQKRRSEEKYGRTSNRKFNANSYG